MLFRLWLKKLVWSQSHKARHPQAVRAGVCPPPLVTAEVLVKQNKMCRSMVEINHSIIAINSILKEINENLKRPSLE